MFSIAIEANWYWCLYYTWFWYVIGISRKVLGLLGLAWVCIIMQKSDSAKLCRLVGPALLFGRTRRKGLINIIMQNVDMQNYLDSLGEYVFAGRVTCQGLTYLWGRWASRSSLGDLSVRSSL